MNKSIILLILIAFNAFADPDVVVPQGNKAGGKNVVSIEKTFSKVAAVLESAFDARASVKDEQSLAESGVKLENLAKEMLAIEAEVDMAQKPDDKQMRDLAVRFMIMNDKVQKQMKEVGMLGLSQELINARDAQFAKFLKTIEPMAEKTRVLFPPEKLSYLVEQIKAEEARKNP